MKRKNRFMAALLFCCSFTAVAMAETFNADRSAVAYEALDLDKLAREDVGGDMKGAGPMRFAIGHVLAVTPGEYGRWSTRADGRSVWTFSVKTPDAVHLGFGFNPFHLPDGAVLNITSSDGNTSLGPFTAENNNVTGQFWTPILFADSAVLELTVPAGQESAVQLQLVKVGHGYRGFGKRPQLCKSGACEMDVACLGANDPWNKERRAVAAYTEGAEEVCTGTLINNTANDRRLLFVTATHCKITSDAHAAQIVAYWNYESPTCRIPGSTASGTPVPMPNTTYSGARFLASHLQAISDWTLLEFVGPWNPALNHYWAGWDRTGNPVNCSVPSSSSSSTTGLCATIHHPRTDEKRITFAEAPAIVSGFPQPGGTTHWFMHWDTTPPILPGLQPPPSSVVPGVTETGSSGSALFDPNHRLIGVLSGGRSFCGADVSNLNDYFGRLAISWEGEGTPTTAMKTHLDPLGNGTATVLNGLDSCSAPAVPANVSVAVTAANRIRVTWTPVSGISNYRVLRSTGACPGSRYTEVGQVSSGSSFIDTTASGGTTYSYKVVARNTATSCDSPPSACASTTATGVCTAAPVFGGVIKAESGGAASCAIDLSWSPAASSCTGNTAIRYNVYRSSTAGFTPSPANLLQSCVSGTNASDTAVVNGATYHYVVRAEDAGGNGGGVCAGGLEDANAIVKSTRPLGALVAAFKDGVESGTTAWQIDGSGSEGANFAVVTNQAHSPTHAWYVPDPPAVHYRRLTTATSISVPMSSEATFDFWHRYDTDAYYDGGVLQYSLDGGSNWSDILGGQGPVPANMNRFRSGPYDDSMDYFSAFGVVRAWHGNNNPGWIHTIIDLADFAGRDVKFRFYFGTDQTIAGDGGWWIDDIRVSAPNPAGCVSSDRIFANGFQP